MMCPSSTHRQLSAFLPASRVKTQAKSPILPVLAIVNKLPDHLGAARVAGLKAWGVELDDKAQIRNFKPQSSSRGADLRRL